MSVGAHVLAHVYTRLFLQSISVKQLYHADKPDQKVQEREKEKEKEREMMRKRKRERERENKRER